MPTTNMSPVEFDYPLIASELTTQEIRKYIVTNFAMVLTAGLIITAATTGAILWYDKRKSAKK